MAVNIGNLQAQLAMDTAEFKSGVAAATGDIGNLGGKIAAFGQAAAIPIAAVGAAFVALGTAAIASADSVDQAMRTIRVGTGATGEDLDALGDNLRNVLKQVPDDAGEVSTAIAELNTRLGLSGDALEDATIQFTTLSRITGTDVKTNITTATRLFGDFSVATEDQADTLDYLFRVSQNTGASVDQLASRATQYGTSLRGMGFDLKTSIAMLGKFEKEGVNTETVLASLKIGMANMAKAGITDANEAFSTLINDIKSAPSDLEGTQKAIEVFGSRAGADMAMAIREGRFEFDDLMSTLDASGDTIIQAAKDSETLGDKIGIMKNRIGLAIEPLGAMLIGVFSGVFDWFDENGEELFTPVMGALAAVGDWWKRNGEGIFRRIGDAMLWLKDMFQPFVDLFLEFWTAQAAKMTEFWETDGETVMQALENIRAAFQTMIERIAAAWKWLWPYLEGILGPAVDILLDLVGIFAALLAGDWEKLGEKLVDLTVSQADLLYGIFELLFDLIVGVGVGFADKICKIMTGAMNGLLGIVEGAINTIIDHINLIISFSDQYLGTNFRSVISRVSLTRVEAPTIKAPTLSEMTGGLKPSDMLLAGTAEATGQVINQTITVISPEPLSPAQVGRETMKAQRRMGTNAYGGH